MTRRAWAWAILFALVLASCRAPSPTAEPTSTSEAALTASPTVAPTPTWVSPLPTATALAHLSPLPALTATPLPTPTPPPSDEPSQGLRWKYWPSAIDFRSVAVDGDALWIAALSGLVRYEPLNGRWQVWTVIDGLVDNVCTSVVVWKGLVWVGTQGGISHYDPASGDWQSYTVEHGLPDVHNIHLYLDSYADTLWAGTSGGLAHYDPRQDRWVSIAPSEISLTRVQSLFADLDFLWIGVSHSDSVRGGIFRLDKTTGQWQDMHLSDKAPPPDDYALVGNEGYVWAVGLRENIPYEYNQATGTWRKILELDVGQSPLYLYPAYRSPELWFWGGTVRYNVQTKKILRTPLPKGTDFVQQGLPDWGERVAWVPGMGGLYALDTQNWKWTPHGRTDAPPDPSRVLAVWQGRLFVTTNREIGIFDPLTGGWQIVAHVPDELAQVAAWIAQRPGSDEWWAYSPQLGPTPADLVQHVWHYADLNAPPQAIEIPARLYPRRLLPWIVENCLWFEADDALLSFDLESGQWQILGLPAGGYLTAAAQDEGGIWLIKDRNALAHFDPRKRAFAVQPIPWGQGWNQIALSGETVWLAGDSGELLSFNQAAPFWEKRPLDATCVGLSVNALAADKNAVWAGGERGVVRYGIVSEQQTCYATNDDMLSKEVQQIILIDDWVWFTHPWYGLWGLGSLDGTRP